MHFILVVWKRAAVLLQAVADRLEKLEGKTIDLFGIPRLKFIRLKIFF